MSLNSPKLGSAPISSSSRKLAAVIGLVLGSTAMAACGIDKYGTGEFVNGDGGQGGEGGGTDSGIGSDAIFPTEDANTEMDATSFPDADANTGTDADASTDVDASTDAGVDADVDSGKDADVLADAAPDADADVPVDAGSDVDSGVDASIDVDAGPDVDASTDAGVDADADVSADAAPDADAGCLDIPVTFNNMAGYILKQYRGGCDEVNVVSSNYPDGAVAFNTGTLDLCLKPGDLVVAHVKDAADKHSVEFESLIAPMEVEKRKISSGTPASYSEMSMFCAASSGYTLVTDVNPAATGYKYEGNSATDPSDGFRIKY